MMCSSDRSNQSNKGKKNQLNCLFDIQIVIDFRMSDSELRFRRTVKINNKEESVSLLTLAMKKDAEYDKVFRD